MARASPSLLSGFRCGGTGAVNKISDKRYAAISRKPFRSGPLLIAVLAVVTIVGVCWRSRMSWERAGSQLVRQE